MIALLDFRQLLERVQNTSCLVGNSLSHLVGVCRTHLGPPSCDIKKHIFKGGEGREGLYSQGVGAKQDE